MSSLTETRIFSDKSEHDAIYQNTDDESDPVLFPCSEISNEPIEHKTEMISRSFVEEPVICNHESHDEDVILPEHTPSNMNFDTDSGFYESLDRILAVLNENNQEPISEDTTTTENIQGLNPGDVNPKSRFTNLKYEPKDLEDADKMRTNLYKILTPINRRRVFKNSNDEKFINAELILYNMNVEDVEEIEDIERCFIKIFAKFSDSEEFILEVDYVNGTHKYMNVYTLYEFEFARSDLVVDFEKAYISLDTEIKYYTQFNEELVELYSKLGISLHHEFDSDLLLNSSYCDLKVIRDYQKNKNEELIEMFHKVFI